MATNKRKDSAALFELIGRSTLKVPKDASGALKIPSWWSSKSNPASASASPRPAPNGASPAPASSASSVASSPAGMPPSIRPPVKPAPAAPAPPRPSSGVFAPKTFDPATGRPPLSRRLPHPPLWALVLAGGVCVALILIAISVWPTSTKPTPRPAPPARIDNPQPLHPTPGVGIAIPHPQQREAVPTPPPPPRQGQVIPGNLVQRQPGLFYLVITTARTQDVAANNADFIAKHGSDDVAIGHTGNFFTVVSVEGFPKLDDPRADALRKRIVEIGRQHPDAIKRHKGVYDDAYYAHVSLAPH